MVRRYDDIKDRANGRKNPKSHYPDPQQIRREPGSRRVRRDRDQIRLHA